MPVGFGLTLKQAKAGFFDRPAVIKAMSRAEREAMTNAGAYVRRTAMQSMKPAKRYTSKKQLPRWQRRSYEIALTEAKRAGRPVPMLPFRPSKPGQPPKYITRLLKDFVQFSYDFTSGSTIVGPARLNTRQTGTGQTVPEVLEYGGFSRVSRGKTIAAVAARPYMGPALEKNRDKIASFWANTLRGVAA